MYATNYESWKIEDEEFLERPALFVQRFFPSEIMINALDKQRQTIFPQHQVIAKSFYPLYDLYSWNIFDTGNNVRCTQGRRIPFEHDFRINKSLEYFRVDPVFGDETRVVKDSRSHRIKKKRVLEPETGNMIIKNVTVCLPTEKSFRTMVESPMFSKIDYNNMLSDKVFFYRWNLFWLSLLDDEERTELYELKTEFIKIDKFYEKSIPKF